MAKPKHRLRFTKSGRACYISHLDLMATFQRVFTRAEVPIWQTQGFNKHAYVSIALPLSVGYSSDCELLEFTLNEGMAPEDVPAHMNETMPEGIHVVECYPIETPLKRLAEIDWTLVMEYDNGVPEHAVAEIQALLGQESLVIQKKSNKSKKGYTEIDLIPMIHLWEMTPEAGRITVHARLMAQNPGLNPSIVIDTIRNLRPDAAPDFVRYHRNEIYDGEGKVFR